MAFAIEFTDGHRAQGVLERLACRQRHQIMTRVPLHEAKDCLSTLLKRATKERILITRHGHPAGILIGFADEDDFFEYQLENDPRFETRIARSREQKQQGKVTPLEDIESD